MIAFLARRWFLLLVLGGISLAGLAPVCLVWTRRVPPQAIMATSLFLTACTLESRHLYRTLLRPGPPLWAVAISYGFLPALGWLAAPLMPGPEYRVGLMVAVSVPCTLASAVIWTGMAGGNAASTLLSTFLTIGLSCLATPFWLALGTGNQVEIDAAGMTRGLALVLVLPVLVGQAIRTVRPLAEFATRRRVPIGVASRLLILLIVLRAAIEVSDRLHSGAEGLDLAAFLVTATVCVSAHLIALATGFGSSILFGFDRPDRIAVAIGGSQKTLPVALYLFDVYFRGYPLALVPMVCFFIGQLLVDTVIADALVREKKGYERPSGSAKIAP